MCTSLHVLLSLGADSRCSMPSQPASTPSSRFVSAAQYLRMSTDHQQYSTVNQSAAIALYAAAHNIGIVRSFVDEGKSGMSIKGRTALQELLHIVQSGTADFELILDEPATCRIPGSFSTSSSEPPWWQTRLLPKPSRS